MQLFVALILLVNRGTVYAQNAGKANGSTANEEWMPSRPTEDSEIPMVLSATCTGFRDEETAEQTDDINPRNIKGSTKGLTIDPAGLSFDEFVFPNTFRPISGANSGGDPLFGRADQALFRHSEGVNFSDEVEASEESPTKLPGIVKMQEDGSTAKPNPRKVSNSFNQAVDEDMPNPAGISDWLWNWGAFMDHDIVEVPVHSSGDPAFDISVDTRGDPFFEEIAATMNDMSIASGSTERMEPRTSITLMRSEFEVETQEPVNEISPVIDANTVYGHTESRLAELMADDALGPDGSGRLAVSKSLNGADLLPINTNGFCNAEPPGSNFQRGLTGFFLAGDDRANEMINLVVIHTLWMREHNFWADLIRDSDESLTGAEVFEMTRVIIQAEMQHIHYHEFLPVFVGTNAIPAYTGFDPTIRPDADNLFPTCAYRGGHTFISNEISIIQDNGEEDPIMLRDVFFRIQEVFDFGLNPFMRGLSTQVCQASDPYVVFDLRNLLLNAQDDLVARNIQRGRDHGLPTLNTIRESLGLPRHTSFSDFDSDYGERLSSHYNTVDDVECFIGMMSETLVGDSQFGDSQTAAIARQWRDVRDGDEFYYENQLTGQLLEQIQSTTLAQVIERNADFLDTLTVEGNAFIATDVGNTFPRATKPLKGTGASMKATE